MFALTLTRLVSFSFSRFLPVALIGSLTMPGAVTATALTPFTPLP